MEAMSEATKPVEEPKKPEPMVEETPVVTQHETKVGDQDFAYTVTTGRLPLRNDSGEILAQMFFMAYTKDGVADIGKRALMFSFNGGPGSPSLWLHLGALGPKRVKMEPDAAFPAPPYELVDNPHHWLADTDLVFIDPIGTGFSRAKTPEQAEHYWGVKTDIESVGEFIRLYLSRYERWASPLYLVGESYGTTRAAGIAGHLIDRGIAFNGIVLVSSILNFQTARFYKSNDLPFILFLPTYTATAFYHKKLGRRLGADLRKTLREVEAWALGEYAAALAKGDRLPPNERRRVIAKLAEYTGLSKEYVENRDLRIEIHPFCKELLRTEKRTVGRLDSRFKGFEQNHAAERPDHDPSMAALRPAYTAMFNQYVRTELGYKSDLEYTVFDGIKKPWDWGNAVDGPADTSEALRAAMARNPHMKVFIASGYYDLATPYFATEWTLAHMGINPTLRANITTAEYQAGHMMYIHEGSLRQLRADVHGFIRASRGQI